MVGTVWTMALVVDEDDGKASCEDGAGESNLITGDEGTTASSFIHWLAEEPASLASLLEYEADMSNAMRLAMVQVLAFGDELGKNACKSVPIKRAFCRPVCLPAHAAHAFSLQFTANNSEITFMHEARQANRRRWASR
jgi:hypothetical protein